MSDTRNQPESDLLHGVSAIATYLKMTRAQVYHLHNRGSLPTFKMGKTVCARTGTLAQHFAEQEAAAKAAAPNE